MPLYSSLASSNFRDPILSDHSHPFFLSLIEYTDAPDPEPIDIPDEATSLPFRCVSSSLTFQPVVPNAEIFPTMLMAPSASHAKTYASTSNDTFTHAQLPLAFRSFHRVPSASRAIKVIARCVTNRGSRRSFKRHSMPPSVRCSFV